MCITVSAAELSSTKIYIGESTKDDKYIHVIAYKNSASSVDKNAMILPFPTDIPMGLKNMIDTSNFKNFLDDICEATKEHRLSARSFDDEIIGACAGDEVQYFDVGSYSVLLVNHVKNIPQNLHLIPKEKRPEISIKFLLHYNNLYPNQPVAICCWKGNVDAEPLLWWYEPKDPDVFFIPTMDAHDGNPPDPNDKVKTDHIICAGSTLQDEMQIESLKKSYDIDWVHNTVNYNDNIPVDIKNMLPTIACGIRLENKMKNGDMFISVKDVRNLNKVIIKRGLSFDNFHYQAPMNGWWS